MDQGHTSAFVLKLNVFVAVAVKLTHAARRRGTEKPMTDTNLPTRLVRMVRVVLKAAASYYKLHGSSRHLHLPTPKVCGWLERATALAQRAAESNTGGAAEQHAVDGVNLLGTDAEDSRTTAHHVPGSSVSDV
jgi:hypothetical protein